MTAEVEHQNSHYLPFHNQDRLHTNQLFVKKYLPTKTFCSWSTTETTQCFLLRSHEVRSSCRWRKENGYCIVHRSEYSLEPVPNLRGARYQRQFLQETILAYRLNLAPFKQSRTLHFFFLWRALSIKRRESDGKICSLIYLYKMLYKDRYCVQLSLKIKSFPLITSLFTNGPNILCNCSYDTKLDIVYYSVLNVDTKETYSKVVSSCNFIRTVLKDVFNIYAVTFYKHILRSRNKVSYPAHTPNMQYLQQQIQQHILKKPVWASCIHVSRLLQIGFGSQPSLQDDRELTFKSTFLPKEAFRQGYVYLLFKDTLNMSLYCHLLCK